MRSEKEVRVRGGEEARPQRQREDRASEREEEKKKENKQEEEKRRENKCLINERISNGRKRELQRGSAGGQVPPS